MASERNEEIIQMRDNVKIYWCHTCLKNVQTKENEDEILCDDCKGCFVELVEPDDDPSRNVPMSDTNSNSNFQTNNNTPSNTFYFQQQNNENGQNPDAPVIRNIIEAIRQAPFGNFDRQQTSTNRPQNHNQNSNSNQNIPLGSFSFSEQRTFNNTNRPQQIRMQSHNQNPNQNPNQGQFNLPGFIQNYFSNIFPGAQFTVTHGPIAINQRSNAGDYFFGPIQQILNQIMLNDPGNYGTPPSSQEALNSLKDIKMTDGIISGLSMSDCAVCQDKFQKDDNTKRLMCNHYFHVDCIMPWLRAHSNCPVCRQSIENTNNANDNTNTNNANDNTNTNNANDNTNTNNTQ